MKPYPEYKPSGVPNDPLVMSAVSELRHFAADPSMQELERRRKLWRLEYHSGLEAAKEEGKVEVARNMKRKGYATADIADLTGLASDEIERLD